MDRRTSLRYTRDRGPICYELPIFGPRASEATGVEALLASRLAWIWESAVRERPAPRGSRQLRRLEAETRQLLLDQLAYRDDDGLGRFVAVYGLDASAARELGERSLGELLRDFADGAGGTLEVVIVQLGDAPNEYLFVSAEPTAAAQRTLDLLGVAERDWRDVPYRRLQLAALESIYEL